MSQSPNRTPIDTAEHPDLAEAAIEMERRAHARGLRTTQGLGRRWSWSEHLGFGDPRSLVAAE